MTVTVKVQLALLPLASVAVFVTVVTPTGNVLPLGGLLTRFVTPQASVAFTVKATLLAHKPAAALTTRFDGQVICGGVRSTTVTVWLHCAVLPHESVARQVRTAT